MQLDEISRRNLELTRSIRYGSKHGSLISVIDQTMTPMGSRLLNHWLLHPLLDISEILQRQGVIARFLSNPAYLKDLRPGSEYRRSLPLIPERKHLRVNPRELNSLQGLIFWFARRSWPPCLPSFPMRASLSWMNHQMIEDLRADRQSYRG